MIVTFYSYKGGVGRSMALAAVARALALRGLRVLAVDFDLEAPGLERYFYDDAGSASRRAEPGLIDLIAKYREALSDEAAFERAEFQQLERYLLPAIHSAGTRGGSVDLLSAGRRASTEQLRDYALTVRSFDWQDFFYHWKGDRFFDWLRRRWTDPKRGYQVVLVDSRTGVTEMGGVCAYQLADAVLMLCAPNAQNLEGTRDVARDFVSDSVRALRRGRPLQTLAIPARLAEGHPKRQGFVEAFAREMGVLGLPKALAEAGLSYDRLALRFDPALSVGEMALGQATPSAVAKGPFEEDIERLASALLLLADADGPLADARDEAARHLGGGAVEAARTLQADATKASAGYDAFIDFARQDEAQALRLDEGLRAAGLRTFVDLQLPAGDNIDAQLDLALSYSANLLVLFGQASAQPWREQLLAAARARRIRIVPVLLPGADPAALASYGLDRDACVDLRHGVEAVDALVEILVRKAAAAARGGAPDPYPGTRPFGESDAKAFFGRDAEIAKLVAAIDHSPLVVLQGPAQVGKTSLVLAGVVPRLRRRNQPALHSLLHVDARDAEWPQPSDAKNKRSAKAGFHLVVVDHVDSFERGPDAAERAHRLRRLASLSGKYRRLLVVRRAAGDRDPTADDALTKAPVQQIAPLAAAALRQAIEVPARGAGQLFEPGLIERLIDSAGTARNAVAQLQIVLPGLWERRRRGWLTNQGLDDLGHVGGAFARRAFDVLAPLPGPRAAAATALLLAMVSGDERGQWHPRPRRWSELETLGAVAALQLEAGALRDQLAGAALLDLWHEADVGPTLMPVRPDVRAYLDVADAAAITPFLHWRPALESMLAVWLGQGQDDAGLLLDSALHDARQWLEREPGWLFAAEREFIERSVQRKVVAVPQPRDEAAIEAVAGRDVVVLDTDDGASLALHPDTLRDLMQLQAAGPVTLKTLRVLKPSGDKPPSIAALLHSAEGPPGVVALGAGADPWPDGAAPPARVAAPRRGYALVLVPGTLVGGEATFGGLWRGAAPAWRRIESGYAASVFGLVHSSLSEDPIDAAMRLTQACAPQTRLHLLTHGAGGLVAEVLVRAASLNLQQNFGDSELALRLAGLGEAVRTRRLDIHRVVRVACPARGRPLAARRFDVYLSLLAWSAQRAGATLSDAVRTLMFEAVRQRVDPAGWPGLAACQPDSPLLRWLPAVDEPVTGDLRVVAGIAGRRGPGAWLGLLANDGFQDDDSDFVVPTRSMFGGVPRRDGGRFHLVESNDVHHFGYFGDPACADAIADALLLDNPPGFRPIGARSFAGDSPTGLR